eukprot:scaffold172051_cov34-Prasinocladus_malaysianus.AAC.1
MFTSRDGRNLMVDTNSRGIDVAETFEFVALKISTVAAFQTWPRGGGLVHIDATLAESVAGAVVHARARIGHNSSIGSGSVVGPSVTLGHSCTLGSNAS